MNKSKANTKGLKIFLTGISKSINKRELLEFFASLFPSAQNLKPVQGGRKAKHKRKKSAILFLSDASDAKAMLAQDFFDFKNCRIYAKPYLKGNKLKRFKSEIKNKRIFVHNIPIWMGKEQLKKGFSEHGKVVEIIFVDRVKTNHLGESFRHGYLMFQNEEPAKKLVEVGWVLFGKTKLLVLPYIEQEAERAKARQRRQARRPARFEEASRQAEAPKGRNGRNGREKADSKEKRLKGVERSFGGYSGLGERERMVRAHKCSRETENDCFEFCAICTSVGVDRSHWFAFENLRLNRGRVGKRWVGEAGKSFGKGF